MAVADLPVTILDDNELVDLTSGCSGAVDGFAGDKAAFTEVVADARAQVTTLNAVQVRQSGSNYTELLAAADDARDKAYLRFRNKITDALLDDGPPVVAAAERIEAILRARGFSLQDEPDSDQSVLSEALFQDLDNPQSTADLTAIDATDRLATWQTRQQEYAALEADAKKAAADKEQNKLPPIKDVRRLLRFDLALLRNTLELWERRHPDTHGALAAECSEHIAAAVATARARRTREQNEQQAADGGASEAGPASA